MNNCMIYNSLCMIYPLHCLRIVFLEFFQKPPGGWWISARRLIPFQLHFWVAKGNCLAARTGPPEFNPILVFFYEGLGGIDWTARRREPWGLILMFFFWILGRFGLVGSVTRLLINQIELKTCEIWGVIRIKIGGMRHTHILGFHNWEFL